MFITQSVEIILTALDDHVGAAGLQNTDEVHSYIANYCGIDPERFRVRSVEVNNHENGSRVLTARALFLIKWPGF